MSCWTAETRSLVTEQLPHSVPSQHTSIHAGLPRLYCVKQSIKSPCSMYSFHGSVPPEKPDSLTPAPPVEGTLDVWLGPCGWLCLASRTLNKLEQIVMWGEVDSPVLIPRHLSPCSSEMRPRQCLLHIHCEQSSLPANTVVQR